MNNKKTLADQVSEALNTADQLRGVMGISSTADLDKKFAGKLLEEFEEIKNKVLASEKLVIEKTNEITGAKQDMRQWILGACIVVAIFLAGLFYEAHWRYSEINGSLYELKYEMQIELDRLKTLQNNTPIKENIKTPVSKNG